MEKFSDPRDIRANISKSNIEFLQYSKAFVHFIRSWQRAYFLFLSPQNLAYTLSTRTFSFCQSSQFFDIFSTDLSKLEVFRGPISEN